MPSASCRGRWSSFLRAVCSGTTLRSCDSAMLRALTSRRKMSALSYCSRAVRRAPPKRWPTAIKLSWRRYSLSRTVITPTEATTRCCSSALCFTRVASRFSPLPFSVEPRWFYRNLSAVPTWWRCFAASALRKCSCCRLPWWRGSAMPHLAATWRSLMFDA